MTSHPPLPPPRYTVTDKNHRYTITLPSGEQIGPLVSVTTVGAVRAKPQLIDWAAREAADYFRSEIFRVGLHALTPTVIDQITTGAKAAHQAKRQKAADLGTAVHDLFLAIVQGQEPQAIPRPLRPIAQEFKHWRAQSDVQVVACELGVASLMHRAGGRLDYLGWSEKLGGWGVGDYKSGSGFYGNEWAYQAGGGYALMVEEQYGIKITWAEIARFSKKPPYEVETRPVTDIAGAQAGFRELLAVYRRDKTPLIGDPTFTSAGHDSVVAGPT